MIGCLLLLLLSMLSNAAANQVKCIQRKRNDSTSFLACKMEKDLAAELVCCYNSEMNYHYCCPMSEYRSMSHGKRVGGATAAGVFIILLIIGLCIFSVRCPLYRLINKRNVNRDNVAPERPNDA